MKNFWVNLSPRGKQLFAIGLALVVTVLVTLSALANYGHPIVPYFPNPVSITFPRAGRVVLWSHLTSNSPGYFSRYYFIRNNCQVGQTCEYLDVVNTPSLLTPLSVAAGETVQVRGCDCYGGDCGAGGCANPHVGWKTPHHNYFCPNYFLSQNYDPAAGGLEFTDLETAFQSSGDTPIGTPQCWGDWDEAGSNGGYDHDFEDFVLIWAYRDTFSGFHEGADGILPPAGCRAYGWVKHNQIPGLDLGYRLLVDGFEVASGTANQYRADLTAQCAGGTCAFSQDLWGLVAPNSPHSVRVQAQNPYTSAWFDLAGTNRQLVCAAPPTVDLQVDNQDGPLTLSAPADYMLDWTSANADTCSASGSWSGSYNPTGFWLYSQMPEGTFIYTLTCSNPIGSASDSVTVTIHAPPTVDVKVNNLDGPLNFFQPAAYTVSWTSANASACQAEGSLSGAIGVNGSQAFTNMLQGIYTYTVRCFNPAGAQAVDSVQLRINPLPPTVDLKVDGVDGPVTRLSPASYTLSWTSQNAASCTASSTHGGWAGAVPPTGSQVLGGVLLGTYTHTLTCTNLSGSASDAVAVFVVAPLSASISVTYARLPLFAASLGQPSQTLTGTTSGGEPPYTIAVHVRAPSGSVLTLNRSGSVWSVTPQNSGELNFGSTEMGIWSAWASLTDHAGRTFQTSSVIWEVAWYPVHARP